MSENKARILYTPPLFCNMKVHTLKSLCNTAWPLHFKFASYACGVVYACELCRLFTRRNANSLTANSLSLLNHWPTIHMESLRELIIIYAVSLHVSCSLARSTRWLSFRCPAGPLRVCAPLLLPSWQSLSMCWWYRGGLGTNPLWSMAGELAGCVASLLHSYILRSTDPLKLPLQCS